MKMQKYCVNGEATWQEVLNSVHCLQEIGLDRGQWTVCRGFHVEQDGNPRAGCRRAWSRKEKGWPAAALSDLDLLLQLVKRKRSRAQQIAVLVCDTHVIDADGLSGLHL